MADNPGGGQLWRTLRDHYGTLDLRWAGLFRILLALCLFADLAQRASVWGLLFGSGGVMPPHVVVGSAQYVGTPSWLFTFISPVPDAVTVAIAGCVYLGLLLGIWTRLWQVLTWFTCLSLVGRGPWLAGAQEHLLCWLTLWSALLPLGSRLSLDAFLERLRNGRSQTADANQRATLAVAAILVLYVWIYLGGAIHADASWRQGTALHYYFHHQGLASGLGAWALHSLPEASLGALTQLQLGLSGMVGVLLLVPVARLRRWLVPLGLALGLSCLGLDSAPLDLALLSGLLLFLPAGPMERLQSRLRSRRALELSLNPTWPGRHALGRAIAACDVWGRIRLSPGDDEAWEAAADEQPAFLVRHLDSTKWLRGEAASAALLAALPWMFSKLFGAKFAQAAREPERFADWLGTGYPRAPRTPGRLAKGLGEALALALLAAVALSVARDTQSVTGSESPLRALDWVVPTPFLAQSVPRTDGRLTIEVRTASGARFDPLRTGADASADPLRHNRFWHRYTEQLRAPESLPLRTELRRYVFAHAERTGDKGDQPLAFAVWWHPAAAPPPQGQAPEAAPAEKILGFGRVDGRLP